LRGALSFPGDAHQAMYACALAGLNPEPTRIGNLPEAAWFAAYRAALEALGVAFEPTEDGHTLVRGPREGLAAPAAPVTVRHELAALILAGLCSGRGLNATVIPDPEHVPGDVIALLKALWPQPVASEPSAAASASDGSEATGAAPETTPAAPAGLLIGTLNPKARGLVKPYE